MKSVNQIIVRSNQPIKIERPLNVREKNSVAKTMPKILRKGLHSTLGKGVYYNKSSLSRG